LTATRPGRSGGASAPRRPEPRAKPRAARRPAAATGSDKHRICVARIGAAHGICGEVKLWPYTVEPLDVGRYGPLQTEDGQGSFEIESLRPAGDCFIAKLKGVTDRSAAERLRQTNLYVSRAQLPALPPDEFYHADLIDLAAEDRGGKSLGKVVAVHNFGAGDLLEIAPAAGGDTVLFPFTAAHVPEVDIAAGRIVLDRPDDFFEPERPPRVLSSRRAKV
jgi:16S rRNA processing protein RimM